MKGLSLVHMSGVKEGNLHHTLKPALKGVTVRDAILESETRFHFFLVFLFWGKQIRIIQDLVQCTQDDWIIELRSILASFPPALSFPYGYVERGPAPS